MFTNANTLKARLTARFTTAPSPTPTVADAKLFFLRVAVDLQVTKASALRTYDALLVTVSGLLLQRSDLNMGAHIPLGVVVGLALLAALLTLGTSWTSWPTTARFDTEAGEIEWLAWLLSVRGNIVNIAVIASVIATVALGIALYLALPVTPSPPPVAAPVQLGR
jgi:hypothetical protein